jgi:hypothetical protein
MGAITEWFLFRVAATAKREVLFCLENIALCINEISGTAYTNRTVGLYINLWTI